MTPQQIGFALAKTSSHPDPLAFADAFAAACTTVDDDMKAAESAKTAPAEVPAPAPEAPAA